MALATVVLGQELGRSGCWSGLPGVAQLCHTAIAAVLSCPQEVRGFTLYLVLFVYCHQRSPQALLLRG